MITANKLVRSPSSKGVGITVFLWASNRSTRPRILLEQHKRLGKISKTVRGFLHPYLDYPF
jgi:hypothetical protein